METDFSAEAEAAMGIARAFVAAFSARDHETLATTLNYPHVRLAEGRFATIESAVEFVERSRKGDRRLERENFGYSGLRELEAIQAGADKVHLRIINDRHHPDGTVYMTFNTLWIATLQDGKWGIQFRSSYLVND